MSYKKCGYCGHANNATNKFCESCGSILNVAPESEYYAPAGGGAAQAPEMIKKSKGGKAKIIVPVILAVLLVGGGVFAYFQFFAKTTVDLVEGFNDKVLNLSGYNGEGSIMDMDISKIKELQNYYDASEDVKKFLDSVDYTTDKDDSTDLSRGDKVVITATFDQSLAEDCGVKVKNASGGSVEKTIAIERLKDKPEEKNENYSSDSNSGYNNNNSYGYENNYDDSSSSDSSYDSNEDEKMTADNGAYYTVSEQELTEEDIEGWSRFEVQMYINYIYTKHGYKLGDSTASAREQREHFEQLNWYNEEPRLYSGESEMPMCESHFTDIENHNKRVLVKRRNWLKKHE